MDQNIEERILQLQESVKVLAEEFKKSPSPELELKLNRETDLLRHLTNSAIGDPKERSKETADVARIVAQSRAIQPL